MIRALAVCLAVLPGTLAAQQATSMALAELRVLDKVTGQLTDLRMQVGQPQTVGTLIINMNDCRVPSDNPTGDAFVEMSVTHRDNPEPVFDGWMIASAPALNAMDHPRYDVWVIGCAAT